MDWSAGRTWKNRSKWFNVHGTVHRWMCILYNQQDATYTMSFITVSALHVTSGFSAYHQELIKLYVQSWILSCFPAVYCWCGLGGTVKHIQFYKLLMMGGKIARNM